MEVLDNARTIRFAPQELELIHLALYTLDPRDASLLDPTIQLANEFANLCNALGLEDIDVED